MATDAKNNEDDVFHDEFWFFLDSLESQEVDPADWRSFDPRRHTTIWDQEENAKYFTRRDNHRPHYITEKVNKGYIQPPPKPLLRGSWKHCIYAPEWTDPGYFDQDHALDRDGRSQARMLPLGKSLRPAQLAQDELRNPTPYAKRFGIHPGRRDGRSCMTPTAELKFRLPIAADGSANFVEATEVATLFKAQAASENLTTDELHERLSDPETFDALNDYQKSIVNYAEQIRAGQDWQANILYDLTTDELISAGIFEILDGFDANETVLDDSIDPLFERYRWIEQVEHGHDEGVPKIMYQVKDRRGVFDPNVDDWIWEKMQPMLRLVSRMWQHASQNDPYWRGLLNPFNREELEDGQDLRSEEDRLNFTARRWTHRTSPDEKIGRHEYAQELDDHYDGVQTTLNILYRTVRFRITSASHLLGEKDPKVNHPLTAGQALSVQIKAGDNAGGELEIHISAEYLYAVLQDGYSTSEKILANFVVACSMMHELAHAVYHAQVAWMNYPKSFGIDPLYGQEGDEALSSYFKWLHGNESGGDEHFFEDETEAEAGFSAEKHTFGGSVWTAINQGSPFLQHLMPVPSGISFLEFPGHLRKPRVNADDGIPAGQEHWEPRQRRKHLILRSPHANANQLRRLAKWRTLAKFFTRDFWDTHVTKFGPSALLVANEPDTKITNAGKYYGTKYWRMKLEEDPEIPPTEKDLIKKAVPSHNPLLQSFINIVMTERYHCSELAGRLASSFEPMLRIIRVLKFTTSEAAILYTACQAASYRRILLTKYHEASQQVQDYKIRAWSRHRALLVRHRQIRLWTWKGVIRQWPVPLQENILDMDNYWNALDELEEIGKTKINPLCKRGQFLAQDISARVQLMVAELWRLTDRERATVRDRVTNAPFYHHLMDQLPQITYILQTLQNYVSIANIGQAAVVQDVVSSFTVTRAKWDQAHLAALNMWHPPPPNWADRLALVPTLFKSRRETSSRWLHMARREMQLLPAKEREYSLQVFQILQRLGNMEQFDDTPMDDDMACEEAVSGLEGLEIQPSTLNVHEGQEESLFKPVKKSSALPEKLQSLKRRNDDDEPPEAKKRRLDDSLSLTSKREAAQAADAGVPPPSASGPRHDLFGGPAAFKDRWRSRKQGKSKPKAENLPKRRFDGTKLALNLDRASPFACAADTTEKPWGVESPGPSGTSTPLGPENPVSPWSASFPASIGIFPHAAAFQASTTVDLELLAGLPTTTAVPPPNFQAPAFQKPFNEDIEMADALDDETLRILDLEKWEEKREREQQAAAEALANAEIEQPTDVVQGQEASSSGEKLLSLPSSGEKEEDTAQEAGQPHGLEDEFDDPAFYGPYGDSESQSEGVPGLSEPEGEQAEGVQYSDWVEDTEDTGEVTTEAPTPAPEGLKSPPSLLPPKNGGPDGTAMAVRILADDDSDWSSSSDESF